MIFTCKYQKIKANIAFCLYLNLFFIFLPNNADFCYTDIILFKGVPYALRAAFTLV